MSSHVSRHAIGYSKALVQRHHVDVSLAYLPRVARGSGTGDRLDGPGDKRLVYRHNFQPEPGLFHTHLPSAVRPYPGWSLPVRHGTYRHEAQPRLNQCCFGRFQVLWPDDGHDELHDSKVPAAIRYLVSNRYLIVGGAGS